MKFNSLILLLSCSLAFADGETVKLHNGLIGAWVTAGPTGATVRDYSSLKEHGAFTNMEASADWHVDWPGWVIDLDGTDEYVELSNPSQFVSLAQITVSVWVFPRGQPASGEQHVIISKGNKAANKEFRLRYNNSGGTLGLNCHISTDGSNEIGGSIAPFTLQNNTWYHIALTWDGTTSRVYLDGIQGASGTSSGAINSASVDLHFGAYSDLTANDFWDGFLSNIFIWNRALNPNDILFLHRNPRGPFALRDDIVVLGTAAAPSTRRIFNISKYMKGWDKKEMALIK